ncbi:Uncharacterized protein Rs2_21736 [Raphanus sativus]|nr:Uncharacterized protein Rs2_21736 [Raphanus sativus]
METKAESTRKAPMKFYSSWRDSRRRLTCQKWFRLKFSDVCFSLCSFNYFLPNSEVFLHCLRKHYEADSSKSGARGFNPLGLLLVRDATRTQVNHATDRASTGENHAVAWHPRTRINHGSYRGPRKHLVNPTVEPDVYTDPESSA